ncbi:MAG TPA: hypothetical protein PLF13_05210 [candidate division Zixibacteria bacterium]|nr:hypothetical protein [candidate division Zixibacteria bacterium]
MRLFFIFAAVFLAANVHAGESPVNQPIRLAAYTLEQPDFNWQTRTTAHYRIHYLPGSTAERQLDSLSAYNEEIITRHLALLNETAFDRIIDLFYFDSREQIESIVSKPFRALADAASMTVLAVRNDSDRARDAHEIMHVVSFDLWGGWDRRNDLAWLSEGLATRADDPCNGYNQTELAAHILFKTNSAPSLDSLALSFREYPEMIGYMLAASFVDYVIDRHGIDKLHRLWQVGYAGLEDTLGLSIADIERDWITYVRERYPDPDVPDWPDLEKNGCR